MKKLLTIMMVSALVLALTVPAMAMHMEMNGQFRARSWVLGNYIGELGSKDDSTEFVDQRLRLTMKWGLAENISINARADVLEGFWGDRTGSIGESTSIDPTTGDITTVETFFETSTKTQIAFDQVYGQFTLPAAPVTVVVGRQGVNWGVKMAVAGDNRDRLKLLYKGPVTLGFVYDKFRENFVLNASNDEIQDSAGYGVLAVGKMGGFNSGLIYYYVSNKSNPAADTKTSNVDFFTMGAAGPVDLKFEINYLWGDKDANNVKTDLTGLNIYAGGFFKAGMTNLGLEVAYARGDDPNTADENEGSASMDYDGPFWSIILYHNFDYDGFQSVKSADRGVTNALALKGSVTASPSEKLTLIGAVVWAQQDEAVGDDDLGVELDAIAVYNIYDNVAYTLGFGYLIAGDAFGGDIDDPWGLLNRVEIKF